MSRKEPKDPALAHAMRWTWSAENRNGTSRWYWKRPGHALARLPGDPVLRVQMAKDLNEAADRGLALAGAGGDASAVPELHLEGTIGWTVAKYKSSEKWTRPRADGGLAEGTKKYYRRFLADIYELGPRIPFRSLDYAMTEEHIQSYTATHDRRKAKAVLQNLFKIALRHRYATANHAGEVEVSATKSRDAVFSDEEALALVSACDRHPHGPKMRIALALLRFTAQRANDCLGMKRLRYDAIKIELRQEKTDLLIWVPAHSELRAILDAHLASYDGEYLVPGERGEKMSYSSFIRWFGEIRAMAAAALPPPAPGELHLTQKQPRDFRRTAMVRMAEAGVRVQDIAAVSGHSIDQTQTILDTYIPRTYRMAQNAIRQWEAGAPTSEVLAALDPAQLEALAKALAKELRAGGQLPPDLALVPSGPPSE
jgi:integrase